MRTYLAQNLTLPGLGETSNVIQGPIKSGTMLAPGGKITLGSIISTLIPFIFVVAGISLLIVIMSAGFTLLTSGGDTKKMEKGKQQLTSGIIGFVIIFAAYWIVQIMGLAFGVDTITSVFK